MRGTYSLGNGFGSSAIIGDRQVMAGSGRLLDVRFWPVAAHLEGQLRFDFYRSRLTQLPVAWEQALIAELVE